MDLNEKQYQQMYEAYFREAYLAAAIMPELMMKVQNFPELFEPGQRGILAGINECFSDTEWYSQIEHPGHAASPAKSYSWGYAIAKFAPEFIPLIEGAQPGKDGALVQEIEGLKRGVRDFVEEKIADYAPGFAPQRPGNDRGHELHQGSKDKDDVDR